ncbi:hypothetical protein JHD46_08180 [Sulfurimonas sp. SAG-AH-194-C20]|nr:hypothetical protein [Sulfurimonas sp. SAG-AH-194-C20]MDF1879612.1 hypothetical protein [Sulfurimonas sp. SAG-AH-194-C20]
MISSYKLDPHVNRVSFVTNRENGLSTGYKLDVYTSTTGIDEILTTSLTLEGKNSGSYVFGSEKGISLEGGMSFTSTSYGESSTSIDPIIDLLKKTVIVSDTTSSLYVHLNKGGLANKDSIVFVTISQLTDANLKLSKGDISGYCSIMMGLSSNSGNNVKIDFSNVDSSPIIKNLMESGRVKYGSGDEIEENSLFHVRGGIEIDVMQTVEDIFEKILVPLGLELYWTGDNIYSLESPRFANDNSSSIATISNEDIVSLDISSNPYDTPSLLLPMELENEIIGVPSSVGMANVVSSGILPSDSKKGRSIKIETYNIPSFLINPLKNASFSASNAANKSHGSIATMTTDSVADKFEAFYGSFARKTSLYQRNSGSCILALNPKLVIPYAWYNINGEDMFVSSIMHDITRTKSSTILTILGIRRGANSDIVVEDTKVKEAKTSEDKVVDEIVKKAKLTDSQYVSSIKASLLEITSSSITKKKSHHELHGANISKKEMNAIFGDDKEEENIKAVSEIHTLIEAASKE